MPGSPSNEDPCVYLNTGSLGSESGGMCWDACASVAAGADGVHVEVHNCPEKAMSDGPQALLPHQFLDLMGDLRRMATSMGRNFWNPEQ